ncbi:Histone transcription regulator, putative [Candida maltosa Xu316]|uniref:Protein HIR n=1 Tax=Candida maltosa (strain Xu316) TaxID=1245528 RepID=M3HKT1_CANMX|nr:Histone transcription regulator, putative [Candida maltosa Xu316]
MKVLKLPQVFHDGDIHSIDINNDNSYLISSGKDNTIGIWDLPKLIQICSAIGAATTPELKKELRQFKTLQNISCHTSLINSVRFLPNTTNEFVSSDVNGYIFHHTIGEPSTSKQLFPCDNKDFPAKPIIDLSVSPDGRLIAWSTNDGKVFLFDLVKNTVQELTTICHEKPMIQRSLAFDPTNNFLITVGDDTQINLYQFSYEKDTTTNYKFRLINKISRYFSQNPLNVRYKRISWSPEGELIPIPTATKNQTMMISLLSRSSKWGNAESLVGHDTASEVVKFCPKIFSEKENDTSKVYTIVASAGSDKTIAIWNSTRTNPITILTNLANGEVHDMAWTSDGKVLLFATSQGKLGISIFDDIELGYAFDNDSMKSMIKMNTISVEPMTFRHPHEQTVGNRKQLPPIEFLLQKDATSSLVSGPTKESKDDDGTKKKDGVKKDVEPTSKGVIEPEVIESSNVEQPTEDILESVMANRVDASPKPAKPVKAEPKTVGNTTNNNNKPSTLSFDKQKVTTKNGKRRIQPTLISTTGGPATTPATDITKPVSSQTTSIGKSSMEFDKPSYSVSEEFYRNNKRPRTEDVNGTIKKVKREMEPVKFIGSVVLNPNTSFSKVRIATPKIRSIFQIRSKNNDNSSILDVRNGTGNESKPSKITYFKKEKEIWCDFIPKYIQLATEGSDFWAITTNDGHILTYSHISGKRLLPTIVLGSPVSFLESHNNYLMAVSCTGELHVWDLQSKKNVLKCSIGPLLQICNKEGLVKSDNITLCAVTSLGIPLVTLSNGSGYLYNKDLAVWQTVTESWWSFGSHYWDSSDKKPQTLNMFSDEQSIIELLEHRTNEEVLRKTRIGRGKFFNKISKNMLMKELCAKNM